MNKIAVLGLTLLLLTLAEFNASIFVPSMPAMVSALGVPTSSVQLLVVIAMIAFGAGLFVWGPLSDRRGRRVVVLMGLGLYFIGSIVVTMASSIGLLMVGRALQGLGISCAGAILPVIPKDIFSGAALSRAFSVISMAFGIMPMVGQVLGGYLQSFGGWRLPFFFLCAYSALVWIVLFKFLPETHPNLGVPASKKSVVHQYWSVLSDRVFLGYLACMILMFAGEMAYIIVTPFLLQNDLGVSSVMHGWLSVFPGMGLLGGALLSARLAASYSSAQLVYMGIIVATLGLGLMAAFSIFGILSVMTIVAPICLYMLGAGLIYPNAIAGIMNRFPDKSGVAGSLMSSLQMMGAGAFAALMTALHIQTQTDLCLAFTGVLGLTMLAYRTLIPR